MRGASAIGVPGCPEFAFWTASIAKVRMVLMHSSSIVSEAPSFGFEEVFEGAMGLNRVAILLVVLR